MWQSSIVLGYNTTYFWKVRAAIGSNVSAWSSISTFTTIVPPLAPAPQAIIAVGLENPRAGAEGVSLRPAFAWKSVAGAERYELLVATNSSFSNPVIDKTGPGSLSVTAWQNDVELDYGTTYYWKIRAVGTDRVGPWSDIGAFITLAPPPPKPKEPLPLPPLPSAELYSPVGGAGNVSIRPVFRWSEVAGAEKYEVLVATDIAFSVPALLRTGSYAIPATPWRSEVGLAYDTTYYWKVKAVSGNSNGDWSLPGVFTTEPPAPQLPLAPATNASIPPWAIYVGISLLVINGLLLVAMLILLGTINRY